MRVRALAGSWTVAVGLWALDYNYASNTRLGIVLSFLALTMTLAALALTYMPPIGRAYMNGWEDGNEAGIKAMRAVAAHEPPAPADDAATVTPLHARDAG
jgi:hypothetical protein